MHVSLGAGISVIVLSIGGGLSSRGEWDVFPVFFSQVHEVM
jgi:hypothetical protein